MSFSEDDCTKWAALAACKAVYRAVLLTLSRVAVSQAFSPLAIYALARCNFSAVSMASVNKRNPVLYAPPTRRLSQSDAAESARVDPATTRPRHPVPARRPRPLSDRAGRPSRLKRTKQLIFISIFKFRPLQSLHPPSRTIFYVF